MCCVLKVASGGDSCDTQAVTAESVSKATECKYKRKPFPTSHSYILPSTATLKQLPSLRAKRFAFRCWSSGRGLVLDELYRNQR
ncbi:hypothetical protein PBY51_024014 [Eleginops maclovinus]|uniref:Uncharacterized protein n=1 Tax=Eleginops maclovinus TaxID=56733 RepID=A0AAN7XSY1_ELEMC|nr:hypothetical protein PBY51_024014 [Eleginops maclovinus]